MTEINVFQLTQPGTFADPLTQVLRNGARALLAQAVEAEVAALLADRGALSAGPRPRQGRVGAHQLFVSDTSALRAADEEPRSSDPDPLPRGHLHRRLRGGAGGAARQGCRRAVGIDHHRAQGGLV